MSNENNTDDNKDLESEELPAPPEKNEGKAKSSQADKIINSTKSINKTRENPQNTSIKVNKIASQKSFLDKLNYHLRLPSSVASLVNLLLLIFAFWVLPPKKMDENSIVKIIGQENFDYFYKDQLKNDMAKLKALDSLKILDSLKMNIDLMVKNQTKSSQVDFQNLTTKSDLNDLIKATGEIRKVVDSLVSKTNPPASENLTNLNTKLVELQESLRAISLSAFIKNAPLKSDLENAIKDLKKDLSNELKTSKVPAENKKVEKLESDFKNIQTSAIELQKRNAEEYQKLAEVLKIANYKLGELQKDHDILVKEFKKKNETSQSSRKILVIVSTDSEFNPTKLPLEKELVLPLVKQLGANNFNAKVGIEFSSQYRTWHDQNGTLKGGIPDNYTPAKPFINRDFITSITKELVAFKCNEIFLILPPDCDSPSNDEINKDPLFTNGIKTNIIYLSSAPKINIIPVKALSWRKFATYNSGAFRLIEFPKAPDLNGYKNVINEILSVSGVSIEVN